MKHLIPCPGCSRHVRASESSCPFCCMELDLSAIPDHVLPTSRLSRAALWTFTATLAAGLAGAGCSDGGGGDGTGGSAGSSSGGGGSAGMGLGSTGGIYGAPPFDSGVNTGGVAGENAAGASGGGGTAGIGVAGASNGGAYGLPPFDAGSD